MSSYAELDLPEYENYDTLRRQVLQAITAGSDYFGFA
jgi:E3 ubiquitin-protein ligase HUWE1